MYVFSVSQSTSVSLHSFNLGNRSETVPVLFIINCCYPVIERFGRGCEDVRATNFAWASNFERQ